MHFITTILWRIWKITLLWSLMVPLVAIAATWQIARGAWDDDPLVLFPEGWWKELWE